MYSRVLAKKPHAVCKTIHTQFRTFCQSADANNILEETKRLFSSAELNDVEQMKGIFVNTYKPSDPNAFVNSIREYEEQLDDVKYKYYLTNIQNSGFATPKGTNFFINRNDDVKKRYFKETLNSLKLSSFGLSTLNLPETNEMDFYIYNMLKLAAIKGVNNIFATSNYCRGLRSQKIVGSVIDTLIKKYRFSREELFVVSDTGTIVNDSLNNNPAVLIIKDIIKEGVLKETDIVKETSFCIHPEFLKYQLNKSLATMNLKTIDTICLNFPFENMEHIDRKEVIYRITKAFEFFEEMALQQKIKNYGISINIKDGTLPEKVLKIAHEAGGSNNCFKYFKCFYSSNSLAPIYQRIF